MNYNFISSVETTSTTYGPNYPSLILSERQHQQSFNANYTALVLEEAEKIYNELITELTNRTMAAAVAIRTSLPTDNNGQKTDP